MFVPDVCRHTSINPKREKATELDRSIGPGSIIIISKKTGRIKDFIRFADNFELRKIVFVNTSCGSIFCWEGFYRWTNSLFQTSTISNPINPNCLTIWRIGFSVLIILLYFYIQFCSISLPFFPSKYLFFPIEKKSNCTS